MAKREEAQDYRSDSNARGPARPGGSQECAAAPSEFEGEGAFEEPVSPLKPPRLRQWVTAVALALVFSGLMYLALRTTNVVIPQPPPEIPVELSKTEPGEDGLPADPVSRVWYWQGEILAVTVPARLTPAALVLIGLLASLLAVGLWWRYRRNASALAPLPPTLGGPAWPTSGRETAERTLASAPDPLQGDLRVWAAACCLDPEPPDPDSAQRLRERLGLQVEPWQIHDLRRDAGDPGLHWPTARRFALINWLLRCAPLDVDGLPVADSPAVRAAHWWKARNRAAWQAQGGQQKRLLPLARTPAKQRWRLEDALLTLISAPKRAATRLQALASTDREIREEIRERLAELRAADQLDPTWAPAALEQALEGTVYFTWALGSLPPETQNRLVKLGFGGGAPGRRRKGLRPSPRLGFALGTLVGLALAAGGSALHQRLNPPGIQLRGAGSLPDQEVLEAQTLRLIDNDRRRVTLGHPKGWVSAEVPVGAWVQIAWRWGPDAESNNPVRPGPGSAALVLQAGTLAQPIRPCAPDWPVRALALIQAAPEEQAARQLAIRLLDSGSADRVWVGEEWGRALKRFLGDDQLLNGNTRLLLVLPERSPPLGLPLEMLAPLEAWVAVAADYDALVGWLGVPGMEDRQKAPVRVLERNGAAPWHRGPEQKEDRRTGITWVPVCTGTFTMGSDPQVDKMADRDEVPAHTVALSAFDIARTEITNAQYRLYQPGHDAKAGDNLPAVFVNWEDARKFCAWAGGDLPTEAQWEYAARGGSAAPWSFGTDAERLGQYAWYSDNSDSRVRPVAGKRPNPLGLYDMHGNAREWVRDRYGDYPAEAQVDPEGPRSGSSRVVRGGSSWLSPDGLRSADRVDIPLGGRGRRFGFRCVRAPVQQH